MRSTTFISGVALAWLLANGAAAQSTLGFGSTVIIPVVANTSSYKTEVFVATGGGNPSNVTVNIRFYEANQSATPGLKSCGTVNVPSNRAVSFFVESQCALAAGSRFGMLIIEDAAVEKLNIFSAYSRTENPSAIGFSVEGLPIGASSPQSQNIAGLKRVGGAAPVPFQSNCFVAALGQPVQYEIRLRNGATGQLIGSLVTGTLQPYEMNRHLDIFAAAGVASGDFLNVTAQVIQTNPFVQNNFDKPLFVSFCTVQNNANFSADFRIGKSFTAWDATHATGYQGCTPSSPGCTGFDSAITDVGKMDVYPLFIRAPDRVKCEILSDRLSELEIRLGATGTDAPWPVVAGGDNATSFYWEMGPEAVRVSDGASLREFWPLQISARETNPAPVTPIPYSIGCRWGNGGALVNPAFQVTDAF